MTTTSYEFDRQKNCIGCMLRDCRKQEFFKKTGIGGDNWKEIIKTVWLRCPEEITAYFTDNCAKWV